MNDRRVAAIRSALEALIESIDATTRIARWDMAEPVPDSLRAAASQLDSNLALANKLVQGNFSGTPAVTSRLVGTSAAIRQLTQAYDEFRSQNCSSKEEKWDALASLDAAIDRAREDMRELD
jgi:hypothetical protein